METRKIQAILTLLSNEDLLDLRIKALDAATEEFPLAEKVEELVELIDTEMTARTREESN